MEEGTFERPTNHAVSDLKFIGIPLFTKTPLQVIAARRHFAWHVRNEKDRQVGPCMQRSGNVISDPLMTADGEWRRIWSATYALDSPLVRILELALRARFSFFFRRRQLASASVCIRIQHQTLDGICRMDRSPVQLHRVDASQNMRRFYILMVQPILFGGSSVIRNWGRIGAGGQRKMETFDSQNDANTALSRPERMKRRLGYLDAGSAK